ncbi:DUF4397 domain-containing protein [Persicimonas caeni]|uniref:DUF4397 domain-containing protein n=1 Tax=Persicimonas caeni TaxID=2292766 RepID=A0A4Y6PTP8_PERCE|nr:DUF4397 domain-containing protein [Persicimonas caeni]QDG51620.1 DUF4397 domain-containing protein [Persicimonas caeni]QED32841.1 DUF4397 domain-containing protein [Persicimonas caeni]
MTRRLRLWPLVLAGALALGAVGCDDDDDDEQPVADVGVGDAGDDAGADVGDAEPVDADDDAEEDAFTGPSALLQVIHESPDPAAQVVDVYVNGNLFIDDFRYRTATAFEQVPADTDLTIALAPGTSDSFDDRIVELGPISLDDGGQFVAAVNGVLDPQNTPTTPANGDISLGLTLLEEARVESSDDGVDQATIFHSSPDTPPVDIVVDRTTTLLSGLNYAEFSNYVDIPNGIHTLDVTNPAREDRRIDSFQTPNLGGGQAFVIAASGFLNTDNSDRPEFALVAYPAEGGEGIELMQAGRVQVVHNSPDAAFDTVDVYIEGELVGDDLTYRQATAALSYPSGIAVDVAIAPSDSASDEDAIFVATPTLAAGATYAGIATGVSDPSQFEPNPGGEDIAFDVKFGVVREVSDSWDMVQLKAFHGVTDAPAIDVVTAAGKQTLVDDLNYGQFSEFFMVDPAPVGLQVTPADQSSVLAQVDVDLSVFEGEALTLVASGFLTPGDLDQTNGTDGPGFAILAIQADGSVTELKPSP